MRLPTLRTYLICPAQSVPAYPFAKDGQPHSLRRGKSSVYMTCLGYPLCVFKASGVTTSLGHTKGRWWRYGYRQPSWEGLLQATPRRWTGQERAGAGRMKTGKICNHTRCAAAHRGARDLHATVTLVDPNHTSGVLNPGDLGKDAWSSISKGWTHFPVKRLRTEL